MLDQPDLVKGKRVVDLASGSGLVGIAAMKAGAASVLAADIDEFAAEAIRLNAELNGPLPTGGGDYVITFHDSPSHRRSSHHPPPCDVILVGDLFYEKDLAARVLGWIEDAETPARPASSAIPAAATFRANG